MHTTNKIIFARNRGYGVITSKTIRSEAHEPFSQQIYYVDVKEQLTRENVSKKYRKQTHGLSTNQLAITNAFRLNSSSPDQTIEGIARMRSLMHSGQVLIVSIYGSGKNEIEQIDDFVQAAKIACEGGAQIIEANLSCPNIDGTNFLYKQPLTVYSICDALVKKIHPLPLIIKVGGLFDSEEQMRFILKTAWVAGAQGVSGINSVPVEIVDDEGKPIYGPRCKLSGISGPCIQSLAIDFIKRARKIITEENLNLVLLGTGGVYTAQDFKTILEANADVALSATGVLHNTNIGREYLQYLKKQAKL
jgi:dihydroorotate dehydrogenase